MSKGSAARPLSVTRDKFDSAFDAIFGKKPAPIPPERLQAAIEHGAGGDMVREVEGRTAPAYGLDGGLRECAPSGHVDWLRGVPDGE